MRAPFNVLVIPLRERHGDVEYAVLKRSDAGWWQFVSGGGEGEERPHEAARRETQEEAGVESRGKLIKLDCMAYVPKDAFSIADQWSPDIYVIPEYHFAVNVEDAELRLSAEHTELRWASYNEACVLLKWDSNRTALWELRERLRRSTDDASALRPL
jgi:dATP pyrophosphohydrolase